MKNHPLIALSLLGLPLATGCAATWDKQTPTKTTTEFRQPIPPLEARDKVTATAKVTLRSGQGVVTLKAPKDIDISKLKVGDRVKADYAPALAVAVRPVSIKPAKSSKAK